MSLSALYMFNTDTRFRCADDGAVDALIAKWFPKFNHTLYPRVVIADITRWLLVYELGGAYVALPPFVKGNGWL
jgi:hypothetical protein